MIIRKTIHFFFKTVLTLAAMAFFFGCERDMDDFFGIHQPDHGGNPGNRIPARTDRNVLLIYSDGYNSLSDFLDDNIDTLMNGWIPSAGLRDNILLLYTHKTAPFAHLRFRFNFRCQVEYVKLFIHRYPPSKHPPPQTGG